MSNSFSTHAVLLYASKLTEHNLGGVVNTLGTSALPSVFTPPSLILSSDCLSVY